MGLAATRRVRQGAPWGPLQPAPWCPSLDMEPTPTPPSSPRPLSAFADSQAAVVASSGQAPSFSALTDSFPCQDN